MQLHASEQYSSSKGNSDLMQAGKEAWVDTTVQPTLSVSRTINLKDKIVDVLMQAEEGLYAYQVAKRANGEMVSVERTLCELIKEQLVFKTKGEGDRYSRFHLTKVFLPPPSPVRLKLQIGRAHV